MRHRSIAGTAALLLGVFWILWRPALPQPATGDLYTHLCTARHLVAGEGFLNDVVYPVSLTFPFAAGVPQPLIHRMPGYALLLTPVVALGADDPGRTEALAGALAVLLVVLVGYAGARRFVRDGDTAALLPWLATLALSPLLLTVVGWAQVELPAGLLLLLLWLRRGDGPARPGAAVVDGLLVACLVLLRQELFWVPVLWLGFSNRLDRRGALVAGTTACLLLAPWWIRNLRVTGDPFFGLQTYAEHLKFTAERPGYTIYTGFAPEWLGDTLRRAPGLLIDKTLAGLRFFLSRLEEWLPVGPALLWLLATPWRRPDERRDTLLLTLTLGGATLLYAPFSHDLRHMAPLLPVLTWACWRGAARFLGRRLGRGEGYPLITATALLAALLLGLAPVRLTGWEAARDLARRDGASLAPALERLGDAPPGPVLTDSAALLWYGRRAGIWWPDPDADRTPLAARVPALRTAPLVRQGAHLPPLDTGTR